MEIKIKILIAEHDPYKLELLERELIRGGIDYISEVVRNEKDYTNALITFVPDIILFDYSFPSFDGPAAFKLNEKNAPDTPFIIVSGTIGEERVVERPRSGVTDYALKDSLFTLIPKVNRALRESKERQQKKQAYQELKESEKKYRQIVETAQEGIWLIDANHKTTFVNDKMCEIFGYSREEMMDQDIFYFMDEEGKEMAMSSMEKRKPGIAGHYHFKYISRDGKEIWTNVSANPLFNDKGEYAGSLAMITNISDEKNAEKKLNKINRLYTLSSQVNQNIVHIKDEEELFRNSCQIAYDFGKFKIAWIGIFNRETERITMVDQKGMPGEYASLFIDVSYQKGGPLDHVLRTGSYYLCNDVVKSLELEHWKPFAAKQGICSLIVLPVKKSGSLIGTFNLYSSELDFFDKEEIALLLSVSEDISFALDIFEKAKKQKETEELIFKTETRFRALIEKSVDMKTLSTSGGQILYGSSSITKFLGYTMDEFIGRNVLDFTHPDDKISRQIIMNLLDTPGKSFFLEQRMLHKNGSWINCAGTMTNMLHEPGVNALVSNFRDVSEKKIIETQMEFDRINLDALINNTTDLMWSVNRDLKLITFNRPFFETIKLFSGKTLAKGDDVFSAALSPEQFDRFRLLYSRAFSGESFIEIEHIEAPIESWSEISFYPIRNGGEIVGTACHSRDITERKSAEEAVLYSLNEKNTILESIGDAFFAADENWIVTYWNNVAEGMLGVMKKDIVGHHLWEVFKDSIGTESYIKYHLAIETNRVIHFEDYYPPMNKWYEISAYPSDKGLAVYFKDITERKLSEIRLNELNDNLKKHTKELAVSNAELERFAYIASHDLQEPLRMITSFLSQLEKRYGSVIDDKGKKYIAFAVDGAKRMRQIILDLLEFSRVGRTEDRYEDLDLNELVKEIQILYRKKIEEKNAVIEVGTLPLIQAYKAPLLQVFQNLIGNALKYSVENIPSHIQITVKELDDYWQFAVTDNGIGIAEEYFEKIFIIFQRLHNKDEYSGTGMGLAITKKIIETMGGRLWVESEEGVGSTFYFTVKRHKN